MPAAELRGLAAAVAFLTRVPVGRWIELDAADVARGGALFPLVGAGIGTVVGGVTHGIIYDSKTGTFTTLDDPNAVGSTLLNGINNKGDIVGFYSDAAGNTHGLLATPGADDQHEHMAGATSLAHNMHA